MQGGGAGGHVAEEEKQRPLEPGGALAVAMVTGDFDLSGIGTVTHVEGNRVYGWGHPFMGLGACEFPLMTGYIHTIYPRQSVSFKMGSPLQHGRRHQRRRQHLHRRLARPQARHAAGADDRQARDGRGRATFNVEVVRQRRCCPALVFTVLTNSVDMEGDLPEELTADLHASASRSRAGSRSSIDDFHSGSSSPAAAAPQALYSQVASVVATADEQHRTSRSASTQIDCETEIQPGRRTADIEAVELDSELYSPGETVKATRLRPAVQGARASGSTSR